MVLLKEEEVLQVVARLKESGLNYKPVQDEMLDHLCCQVELTMSEGVGFSQALNQAFNIFKEDEFNEIQQQILKPKSFFMHRLPLLISTFLFLLVGSYFLNYTPPIEEDIVEKKAVEAIPFHPNDVYQSVFSKPIAVQASLRDENDPPSSEPLANYKITSGFGMRIHPVYKSKKMHRGIDLSAPTGTPVSATADGEVIEASYHKGYGNHIIIKHDDTYQTLYGQLSEMDVEVGQKVKKGDIIGKVGSSGMSTAPHLHYEVIENGNYVDPKPFFTP